MNSDSKLLVNLLAQCTPGNLTPEVFEAIARVTVYPAVEFIPLREKDGEIEVLLFERPKNDIIWPSMLHTPGTILRPTDNDMEDVFKRLYKEELMGLLMDVPISMGFHLSTNSRGRCLLLEYLLRVKGEPNKGVFYRINNLPRNFIPEQLASLNRAVIAFRTATP